MNDSKKKNKDLIIARLSEEAEEELNEEEINARNEEFVKEFNKKLSVDAETRELIFNPEIRKEKFKELTERQGNSCLIYNLLVNELSDRTIHCIMLDERLSISNTMREKGEAYLLEKIKGEKTILETDQQEGKTGKQAHIIDLRDRFKKKKFKMHLKEYIVKDLLRTGHGYYDAWRGVVYFFDKETKSMIEIEAIQIDYRSDFYCHCRKIYGTDYEEYRDPRDEFASIIKSNKDAEIEVYQFTHFDEEHAIEYVNDGKNGIFRLDGKTLKHIDNGGDGIFFKSDPFYTPITINLENITAINYFENGFDPKAFMNSDSLLKKYFIDWASFDDDSESDLTVGEQRLFLLFYFYSLFFKTLIYEKPIITLVGDAGTGKTTLMTLMLKILFGRWAIPADVPDDKRDLSVALSSKYIHIIDNIDAHLPLSIINLICAAFSGATRSQRKYYTGATLEELILNAFMGFTSMEAKFRHRALDDRLLLFYMKKPKSVKPERDLYDNILKNRDAIYAEIFINLNLIINLLKKDTKDIPKLITRFPGFEHMMYQIIQKRFWPAIERMWKRMQQRKGKYTVEYDARTLTILELLEKGTIEREITSNTLLNELRERADKSRTRKALDRCCDNPRNLGKWLNRDPKALRTFFDLEIGKNEKGHLVFTISKLEIKKNPKIEDLKKQLEEKKFGTKLAEAKIRALEEK